MSSHFITKDNLIFKIPEAECSDCKKKALEFRVNDKWVFFNKFLMYCPKCSRREGYRN